MGLTAIEYRVEAGVAWITLSRPRVLNALDARAKRELAGVWSAAAADGAVRVAVVSGSGSAFCAGSDLKEIEDSGPADTMTVLSALPNVVEPFPKPTIAALHGHVLGMGLNLALHCDIRVAHPDTTIGFPEVGKGMISGAGSIALPSLIGLQQSLELLLLGRTIDGSRAAELGLVAQISGDPLEVASRLASQIVSLNPGAVAATLQLARIGAGLQTSRLISEIDSARESLSLDRP